MTRSTFGRGSAGLAACLAAACSSGSAGDGVPEPADAARRSPPSVDASPAPVVVPGLDVFDRVVQASCGKTDTRPVHDFFEGKIQKYSNSWDLHCLAPGNPPILIEVMVERAGEEDDRGPVRVGRFGASRVLDRSRGCMGVLAASRDALEIIAGQDAQQPMTLLRRSLKKPRFETSWAGLDLVLSTSKVETGEILCRLVIAPTPP